MSGLLKLAKWADARMEAFGGSGIENCIKRTLLATFAKKIATEIKNEQSSSSAKYYFLVTYEMGRVKVWEGPFDVASEADTASRVHRPSNPAKKFLVMDAAFSEIAKVPSPKPNSFPTSPIRIGPSSLRD